MKRSWLALALFSLPAGAQAVFVDDDATGANNGSSWADAFNDLQDALLVSSQGDQIWVAQGRYTPAPFGGNRGLSFQLKQGVGLYGGFSGTEVTLAERGGLFGSTILSGDLNGNDGAGFQGNGENSYHVLSSASLSASTVLDGFTIDGGNADGPGAMDRDGAGLFLGGELMLRNCTFRANTADGAGGGIFIGAPVPVSLTACRFEGNHAGLIGGGIAQLQGSLSIGECGFEKNTSDGDGGGLACAATVVITNTIFYENTALDTGGGMHSDDTSLTVIDCIFARNVAGPTLKGWGGGISNEKGSGELIDNLFIANSALRGGGLHNTGGLGPDGLTLRLKNCTLVANVATGALSGGGVYSGQLGLRLHSTILWGNVGPGGTDFAAQLAGVGAKADFCCIQSVDPPTAASLGQGNFADDPRFVDSDGADDVAGTPDDDLRLTQSSPCVDVGDNTVLSGVARDLGGLPRFVDDPNVVDGGLGVAPIIDVGAYEYQTLTADTGLLSLAAGGVQNLALDAGPDYGGDLYLVLGTVSGTSPGITVQGKTIPLNLDPYFLLTLNSPNQPPLFLSFAFFGPDGDATTVFNLPAGVDPILAGTSAHHAFGVIDPVSFDLNLVSNAVALMLVP